MAINGAGAIGYLHVKCSKEFIEERSLRATQTYFRQKLAAKLQLLVQTLSLKGTVWQFLTKSGIVSFESSFFFHPSPTLERAETSPGDSGWNWGEFP